MTTLSTELPDGEFSKPETTWIQTYTGRVFFPFAASVDDVDIVDIAHATANICRYTGHVERFYSVAQHSIFVSHLLGDRGKLTQFAGLLHDASEAYLVDIPSPLKPHFPLYREWEDALSRIIFTKFGLPYPFPPAVKDADRAALNVEVTLLMGRDGPLARKLGIGAVIEQVPDLLRPMTPTQAKLAFLARFEELSG